MRKKINLILICLMAVILTVSLVACSGGHAQTANPDDTPQDITPSQTPDDPSVSAARVELVLTMPSKLNSVLNALYIDDFKLSDIQYALDYFTADGERIETVNMGGVTDDMVSEEDRALLTTKGHHIIRVTKTLDNNKTITKSFTVHLKERGESAQLSTLWFKLDDATPAFGSQVNSGDSSYAQIEVDSSIVIDSWDIFARTFRIYKHGYVYSGVTYKVGDETRTLDATQGFPFTFAGLKPAQGYGGIVFTPIYTGDTLTVRFDLNLPAGATYTTPDDPADMFNKAGGEYYDVAVARNIGFVPKPDTYKFDCYNGLYFAGWYNPKRNDSGAVVRGSDGRAELDRIFNFQQAVGESDIELFAKWVDREYSYTVYAMGGRFASNIESSKNDTGVTLTLENARELGYTVINCETTFDSSTGELSRIMFTGLHYGDKYDKYVAEVSLNASGSQKAVLTLTDMFGTANPKNIIVKGSRSDLKMRGLYLDYTCTETMQSEIVEGGSAVAYIGWELNLITPDDNADFDTADIETLSRYYLEVLFKDSYTIKADGTLRLDKARDESINALVVPDYILIENKPYYISEIGDRAFKNVKSLTYVDLSRAYSLTRIGDEAFAYARNLQEVDQPREDAGKDISLSVIGNDAFANTDYENRYTQNAGGIQFIIINKVIYKFTGDVNTTVVDISDPSHFYTLDDFDHLGGEAYGRDIDQAAVDKFNARLAGATHIMSGVFSHAPKLETLRLSPNIETIEAGSFKDLKNFKNLDVPEENRLQSVSRDAFEGCDAFMSAASGNYVQSSDAIMIGNIYYRQLNINGGATVPIPGQYTARMTFLGVDGESVSVNKTFTVKRIEAFAFGTLENVTTVTFPFETNIESIGEEAFLNTTFIRAGRGESEKYTEVNGILAEYYSTGQTNTTVPDDVKTISGRAFGNYASTIITIEIKNNVQKIEDYAFIGAANLKSVIMSAFEADRASHTLIGAPQVSKSAFADTSDKFLDGVKIYLQQDAYDVLSSVSQNTGLTQDANTLAWAELFRANPDSFAIEEVGTVQLRRRNLISNSLLDETAGEDKYSAVKAAFEKRYSSNPDFATALAVISSVEGIAVRYDEIKFEDIIYTLVTNTESDQYHQYYNEYCDTFLIGYKYQGKDYTALTIAGSTGATATTPVMVRVFKAVMGQPAFDTQGDATKNASTYLRTEQMIEDEQYPAGNFWIEGLDGDRYENGRPTFFTSTTFGSLKIRFGYTDLAGKKHYVDDISASYITVANLNMGAQEVPASVATITVNFYGLGYYVFNYNYSVREAKVEKIVQSSSISIPLNARSVDYTSRSTVDFISEDGMTTPRYINNTNFELVSVDGQAGRTSAITDTLGQHVMKIRYVRTTDTLGGVTLDCDVVYTVVLSATSNLFRFEILDQLPITDENGEKLYDGKAYVAGYTGSNAATVLSLIIPEECTIDGKLYKVTSVGRIGSATGSVPGPVFANCPNLTVVYLPDSMEYIGVNAFKGLERLRTLRTAIKSATDITTLTVENFEEIEGKAPATSGGKPVKFVKLVNLDGVQYQKFLTADEEGEGDVNVNLYSIAIGSEYDFGDGNVYRIVEVADKLYLPERANKSAELFMYFPDTIYSNFAVYENGSEEAIDADNDPLYTKVHYSSTSERFYVYSRFSSSLQMIGSNAFYGCSSLNIIADSFKQSTTLFFIDDGAFAYTGLTRLDLSANTNLTELGGSVLRGCANLTEVVLPSTIGLFGDNLFNSCVMLQTIKLGEATNDLSALNTIGSECFYDCKSLFNIKLSKSITTIDKQIFRGCDSLVITLDFGESEAVPVGWDANWNSNQNPIVYNGNTQASDGKIYYLADSGVIYQIDVANDAAAVYVQKLSLRGDITIPATVNYSSHDYTITSIVARAFAGNTNITSITVSYKLSTIGSAAFENCSALAAFNFADGALSENGLTDVAADAFVGCDSLAIVPTVVNSFTKDGFMYALDRTTGTVSITGFTNVEATSVIIADTVTYAGVEYQIVSIAASAFKQAGNIESVTIGQNVKSIGDEAFMGCSSLTTVTVQGTSLSSIGSAAFKDCTQLSSFTGANNLESVADNAFEGCDLLDPKPQPLP